jgi:hypothetical protein
MTSVISSNLPTPEQETEAVNAAFAAEGYIKDNGTKDMAQMRRRMIDVLRSSEVENVRDRLTKPITRGALTGQVFPGLPGPDSFDEQENPVLARDVWAKLGTLIWGQISANGALQTEVERYTGNGHFVCQTKVGKDQTPAVYLTSNFRLINEDLLGKLNRQVRAKMETVVRVRETLIRRRPQDAGRVAKMAADEFRAVQETSTQRVMLAAAEARAAVVNDAADEDSEPEPADAGSES